MFLGTYNHTVDTKGRLIIPSKFRESLGETFVATKGLDGCIYVYPNEAWEDLEKKLKEMPITNAYGRQLSRFFIAGANACEIDKQGRILLSANLKKHAGIEKDVAIVGASTYFEIWDATRWEEYETQASELIATNPEELAALGI